jgi:hypothetical protein
VNLKPVSRSDHIEIVDEALRGVSAPGVLE